MDQPKLFEVYEELRRYVDWQPVDEQRVAILRPLVQPVVGEIIDDFYDQVARHPGASRVITGGEAQIQRLKLTLRDWLNDLLTGPYDMAFVARRFRVGYRHVEIGLEQFYANVALSRIRMKIIERVATVWEGELSARDAAMQSLNRLFDLDLAIIEYAYQTEFAAREQRQERLVTLGKLAAGIAHELRNPLNAIRTSAYYLINATSPTPEKTHEHLQRIDRQVGLSDNVITALSRFARLPKPTLAPVELCHLVEQTLESNPLPESIELELNCPPDIPAISCDGDQLMIVLGNLIRNACDAMPDGGRLTIAGDLLQGRGGGQPRHSVSSSDGSTPAHAAGSDEPPARFALSVTDTGIGISPDVLRRIMEPLFSTKVRGLGLGLALAQAIMERHGGELTVNSLPGHGTTFTMILNVSAE